MPPQDPCVTCSSFQHSGHGLLLLLSLHISNTITFPEKVSPYLCLCCNDRLYCHFPLWFLVNILFPVLISSSEPGFLVSCHSVFLLYSDEFFVSSLQVLFDMFIPYSWRFLSVTFYNFFLSWSCPWLSAAISLSSACFIAFGPFALVCKPYHGSFCIL